MGSSLEENMERIRINLQKMRMIKPQDGREGWSINNFVIGTVLLIYQNPYICISHKDFKNNLKKFMSKFVLKCGKDLFNVEHTPE